MRRVNCRDFGRGFGRFCLVLLVGECGQCDGRQDTYQQNDNNQFDKSEGRHGVSADEKTEKVVWI